MRWNGKIVLSSILVLTVAFFSIAAVKSNKKKDGFFIHISHGMDDPHRALMALNLANMMADEHDVLVYFDIKAVNLVTKDAEDVTFAHFQSSKTQIAQLHKKGVLMMACPGCLKVAGKSEKDLVPDVQIADKKMFFNFTQGKILSMDY